MNPSNDNHHTGKAPSPGAFRKARWAGRKRGLIGFFVFLGIIMLVLFFDFYAVTISHYFGYRPSREIERQAGRFERVSEQERSDIFRRVNGLLTSGRIDDAKQVILNYLGREQTAQGNYLAGLVYLRQGDIHSAYRYLKEAIRIDPDYYDAQTRLAEIYITVGDIKSAQEEAALLKRQQDFQDEGLRIESEIAVAEGKLDEALAKISQAIAEGERKGTSHVLKIQQAILYVAKGEQGKAAALVATVPLEKLDANGYLFLARYWMVTNNDAQARQTLEMAAARFPQSPDVRYHYGLMLFRERRYADAVEWFRSVYEKMPSSRIAAYRYGQSLVAAGEIKEARAFISTILDKSPNDILALSLKVRCDLLEGKNSEAIAALKQTVALVPEAPRPYTLLGEIYWHEGVLSMAERYMMTALKCGEKGLSPYIVLGDIYMRQGRYERAIHQYEALLTREPSNLVALSQIADAWLNMGNHVAAIAYYDRILQYYPELMVIRHKKELAQNIHRGLPMILEIENRYYKSHPDDVQATIGYVNALLLNNRETEAVAVLDRALKSAPRHQWYLLTRGDISLARGQVEEAKKYFDRALRINPRDVNLLINLASRYEKRSLDKDAEAIYLQAYRLAPEDVTVVNQIVWFYLESERDLEKAKPLIELLRIKGEGAFEKDTVGWYYYRAGAYAEAANYLQEAVRLDPENNVIRAHWLLARGRSGERDKTRVDAKNILERLPAGKLRQELESLCESGEK